MRARRRLPAIAVFCSGAGTNFQAILHATRAGRLHAQVAAQFRIMNIPTLLLFKDGKEVDRIVGVVPKEELTRRIERVIS